MKRKVFIKTYGCQANVYDSHRMYDVLKEIDFEQTDQMEEAQLIVLNTCAIREKATEKVYSELGRIRAIKEKNNAYIAVTGCVSQAEGAEIFVRSPFVDIIVGPQSYVCLPDLIQKADKGQKRLINLEFVEEVKFDQLPEETQPQGVSSFVSIQEGCDQFCTFCVVPYTRGAEFSRPVEQIYREVAALADKGTREVTLLGQNVNGYHGKNHNNQDVSLATLIRYISKIKNIERIRYMTSHPLDMTDDLINLHAQEPKLMPYLHLPFQSGSDKILKSMNRKYSKGQYLEVIGKLMKATPDLALSTDIIVGFPGETDEDFQDTLDLVEKVKFAQAYSFKYSVRPGTPAATMKQVPEDVAKERLMILQKKLQEQQLNFNRKCVGKVLPVLFDKDGKFDGQIIGKTPYMQSVYISNKENLYGKIVDVKIQETFLNSLTGYVLNSSASAA